MDFVKYIRDPIWGDILLTQAEDRIISTKAFRRLRHIKQMSLAYIEHHGAQHTRYEHSIGCVHVVHHLAQNLLNNVPIEVLRQEKYKELDDKDRILKHLRMAALLHDIGHAPMSHLVEAAFHKFPEMLTSTYKTKAFSELTECQNIALKNPHEYGHESFSVAQIMEDSEIYELLKQNDFQHEAITYLVHGIGVPLPKFKIFKPLISGDLDADRLDYINRDFYYCGIREFVDLQFFSRALRFCDDCSIAIDESKIVDVSSFLYSRFKLSQRVHNATSSRLNEQAFMEIIHRYFREMNEERRLRKLVELHTTMTDNDLIFELNERKDEKNRYIVQDSQSALFFSAADLIDGRATKTLTQVVSLTYDSLHPIERFFLDYISRNKETLPGLRTYLIDHAGMPEYFLVDIVSIKPSSMTLPVIKRNEKRSLFDRYYMPHAIYAASITALEIRFFVFSDIPHDMIASKIMKREHNLRTQECDPNFLKKNEYAALSSKDKATVRISLAVKDSVISTAIMQLDKIESIKDYPFELIILFAMYALNLHARSPEKLKHHGSLWFESDRRICVFMQDILCSVGKIDTDNRQSFNEDTYYKVCEQLGLWGVVDHVHKPVPANFETSFEHGPPGYVFAQRVDRVINQWGNALVEYLGNNSPKIKTMIKQVVDVVDEKQDNVLNDLKELASLAIDDYSEEKSAKKWEICNNIISKGGCLLKLT